MKRFLAIAATATTLLGAGAAQAGSVNWSIGVGLPHVATVVSGGPGYYGGPSYYDEPTYVAPRRIYRPVVPAYYEPEYAYPAPVYYGPPAVRFHRPHREIWLPPLPHHRFHGPHWRGHDRQHHQFRGHDRWHHDGRAGHDWRRDGHGDWRR